jgi:natural product biosynthesis luciferase-like monooxygenase protein/amino acid adenylation domain-containing protein/thioester reductase-like protein
MNCRLLPTLVDTLRARAAATPNDTLYRFLVDGELDARSLTYAELDHRARAIAAAVAQQTAPGDRVLLLFAPGLEYISALFGCLYAGRVAVPAYPPEGGAIDRGLTRLRGIATDCRASAVLTDSGSASRASEFATRGPRLAALRPIVTDDIALERAAEWHAPDIAGDSVAFLQYTSGSTAAPRGVQITHDNLRANLAAIFERFGHVTGETRGALWLPPYHDMGLIGGILQPAWGGFVVTLLSPSAFVRRPARWLELISRDRCHVAGAPDFAYDYCARKVTRGEKSKLDLSCWRVAFNGAESVRAETIDRFFAAFADCGFSRRAFYPCYGLAEATLMVTGAAEAQDPVIDVVDAEGLRRGLRRAGSGEGARTLVGCGTAALGELVIVDSSSNRRLPDGEIGEIWVRGPHVARGYWQRDPESAETFGAKLESSGEGPFLKTGDLGYLHEGQLYVTGRLKDLIIVSGRNHYPQDIELTVDGCHPALRPGGSVAFSLGDATPELTIVAEVRRTPRSDATTTASFEDIADRIRTAVSQQHQVRVDSIHLVPRGTLAKTSSGKLQRSACRERLVDGTLASLWTDRHASAETTRMSAIDEGATTLLAKISASLGLTPEALDRTKPLVSYGLDSLALMEIKTFIEERYGVDVPLDVLLGSASASSLLELLGPLRSRSAVSVVLEPQHALSAAPAEPPFFSLFFFASDSSRRDDDVYRLLIESARFADERGFEAIWTPERHFHEFGGHFPNPAVLGAALATITRRIHIRAGSVVAPLNSPVRIAEEWAVVDNLSGGRAGVSFATGWNPNDFVIRPEAYAERYESFERTIEVVRRLWRGDSVQLPNGEGRLIDVRARPVPLEQIPIWITAVKNRATYELAGRLGANLLTNLLLSSVEELASNVAHYRRARAAAGFDPNAGRVTLMIHTLVGDTDGEVRALAEQPLRRYIEASVELWSSGASGLAGVEPEQRRRLVDSALERHYANGLFGSRERCVGVVNMLRAAGVNELACLIDFGVAAEDVLRSLPKLEEVKRAVEGVTAPSIAKSTEPQSWPLTLQQERMWFLQQLEPDNPAYNDLLALRCTGSLDPNRLLQALHDVVRKHEVLRTVFPARDGAPVQRVLAPDPISMEHVDLRDRSSEQLDVVLNTIAAERAQMPFDLAAGPPLRATFVRIRDREHLLLLVIHHIATDGVSARNIFRELTTEYERLTRGEILRTTASVVQQREIALRVRERRQEYANGTRWWVERLSPPRPPLELYGDRLRPQFQSGKGIRIPVTLNADVVSALRQLGRDEGATPFMLLLATFAVLLQRYSGQSRLVIGTPFEGRDQGTADAIGAFVNTLALPIDLAGVASFRALVRQVRTTALETYAHAEVPFGLVVEAIAPVRALGRTPLFQAMFSIQRPLPASVEQRDLRWEAIELDPGTAKFDLRLDLTDCGDVIRGYIEASSDLFVEATVRRFSTHVQNVVAELVSAPDGRIEDVELGGAQEKIDVNAALSGEIPGYDLDRTLDALVFEQSTRTPDNVALEGADSELTYRQLAQRAGALASRLRELGVERGAIVAILAQRSPELVVGLLAILRAGATFLIVDPAQPEDRITFLLKDAAPALVLAARSHAATAQEITRVVLLEPELERVRDDPAARESATPQRNAGDAAYLMYTSGSTGRPKGVLIRHRSIVNRLLWSQQKLPVDASDSIVLKAATSFDVFVWELFAPLVAGARLVVACPGLEREPAALVETLRSHNVTVAHFVPSMLDAVISNENVAGLHLRRVHCSGEVLPVELQNRFFDRLPGVQLINLYGPTEAAVDVTWWICRREPHARSVPIGIPAPNVDVHLLDELQRPVAAGLAGELAISGVQVAAGYLNRPREESASFLEGSDGARWYRTGDIARLRPDGALEFLGRRDEQVKVRGFRIELGEVEAVLREHSSVRDAAVMLRHLPRGEGGLVAYVVYREGPRSPTELQAFLASRLPRQMIPEAFVAMDELPRTGSGKVDRQKLPEPAQQVAVRDTGFETDTLVREVASLFRELLGLTHVASDEDFFDLGGHSLLAAELVVRIHAVFGVDLPLRALFVDSTPRGVASAIVRVRRGEGALDDARFEADRNVLIRDAKLEPSFAVRGNARNGGDILLTGATGFVGAFLLRELIASTDARIRCLVRASSAEHAMDRIRANLMLNGIWDESTMSGRIQPVPGDLARERLGLGVDEYERLARRVNVVYHCGALVDHARLYRALRAPNVSGTKELLALSTQEGISAFHYISTLSVFEAPGFRTVDRVDESNEPADPLCYDSYAQSKRVAERLVHEAGLRGLPVTIHRLAMCTGESRNGRGGGQGLFARFLAGLIELGVAPSLRLDTWLTPVDFVARGICHLAMQHRETKPGVFHMGCPQPVPYEELIERLDRVGYSMSHAPFEQWRAQAISRSTLQSPLYPLLPFVTDNVQELYGRGNRPYLDSEATAATLSRAGIVCPSVSDDLMARYVEFWKEIGLVRKA